jgi:mono/diheme cytochrome c family protein
MLRKILIGMGALVGVIVLGVAGLAFYVNHQAGKTYDMPLPNIQRASSPEALARGEMIYRSVCGECHAALGETHAKGTPLLDFPKELGSFHSANITSDPVGGIGSMKDEEIARMIIHAINREGKARFMPAFYGMADADVAAVIGYMRSGSPDFEPHAKKAPPTELTFPGRLVQVLVTGIKSAPRPPVSAPPKGPTAEYGEYLATALLDCVFCHTAGFSPAEEKVKDPNAYAGGFEFAMDPVEGGGFIYSPNITPHASQGIGKWTLEQFKLALREGVTPDRYILRKPMPLYRHVDDVEIEALYTYLKGVKPAEPPKVAHVAMPRPKADSAVSSPEQLFSALGCQYCHGPKGLFRDKLKNSLGKQPEEVAKWIRNPESFIPGTQMPTFASLIDENQALELARWVQAKGGTP